MRYKRFGLFATAFALVVSSFGGIGIVPKAYAASQTCTWTGTAGDNKFSTAGNWSGCGSAAPQAGDIIAIDLARVTDQQQLQNDINVPLGGVAFSSSDGAFKGLGISTLTLANGAAVTKNVESLSASIVIGTIAGYITSDIIANGDVTLGMDLDYKNIKAAGVLTDNTLNFNYSQGDTFTKLIVGPDAGQVYFALDNSTPADLTFPIEYNATSDNAVLYFSGYCSRYMENSMACAQWDPVTWKVTGSVTVNTPMRISTFGSNVTVNFSGNVSNPAKVSKAPGATLTLNIGATTIVDPIKTTAYDGVKDTIYFKVANNETAVLSEGAVRSSVEVYRGGVLKGTGALKYGISVDDGGTVAPGMSPGCLTADSMALYGTYQFELGGTTACTNYDQIKLLGKNLATGQAAVDLSSSTATLSTSRYNNYTPKQGEVYTIIDNQSATAVEGTFSGLAEGATFEQNGIVFKISYKGGDGNDVTLTVMNTPKAPDTGFALLQSNPLLMAVVTGGIALLLMAVGRKLQLAKR